jgi:hypothetical protein
MEHVGSNLLVQVKLATSTNPLPSPAHSCFFHLQPGSPSLDKTPSSLCFFPRIAPAFSGSVLYWLHDACSPVLAVLQARAEVGQTYATHGVTELVPPDIPHHTAIPQATDDIVNVDQFDTSRAEG